jgi:hypothetical protein
MTIPTTELPEALQKLCLEIEQTNQPITITHQGKPIAIISPAHIAQTDRPAYGFMQGQGEIHGDIITQIGQPNARVN